MNISRFAKCIVYEVVTALLLVIGVAFQAAMHKSGGLETSYFRSNGFLFLLAVTLIGTAVYSYLSYTRRHKQHRADSLFLLLTGLVLLLVALVIFFRFGGLERPFPEAGYTAANINIAVLTALPVPFLVRTFVLALSTREDKPAKRRGVQITALVLTAALVVLLATGQTLHMVRYTGESNAAGSNSRYV